ncbi:WD40-repeat-containing domain protein [Tricharina praecox]|uniref:WD40-repeat-containing domain protein n=1 Tax=Tricharina praecox TaxID=43433 RepID=UPI0022205559|nr:WD40-repeat-containing domain protein [Tricharina praecox]KAI5856232.1 WD40-repeat-containing domain protein [Tricharina praecox]
MPDFWRLDLWRCAPVREPAGAASHSNRPRQPPTRFRTLRIRSIPLGVTEDELKTLLKMMLGSDGFVLSLSGAMATVGFPKGNPANLSDYFPGASYFLGTPSLFGAQKPAVNVFAVAGLAGRAYGSRSVRGQPRMWLREAFPIEIGEHMRVLTFGYDMGLRDNIVTIPTLQTYARSLLQSICLARTEANERGRPVIFIGHSLGRLVIKQALADASRLSVGGDSDQANLSLCVGLFFFGVPDRGVDPQRLRTLIRDQNDVHVIHNLSEGCEFWRSSYDCFLRATKSNLDGFQIVSFFEIGGAEAVNTLPDVGWMASGELIGAIARKGATRGLPNEAKHQHVTIDVDHSVELPDSCGHDYVIVRERLSESVRNVLKRRNDMQAHRSEDEQSVSPCDELSNPSGKQQENFQGGVVMMVEQDAFDIEAVASMNPSRNEQKNLQGGVVMVVEQDGFHIEAVASQNPSNLPSIGHQASRCSSNSSSHTTTQISNILTGSSRAYKNAKHNELNYPKIQGSVTFGDTYTNHYHPPEPDSGRDAQKEEMLRSFAAEYCANDAPFDSCGSNGKSKCLEYTRVDLLEKIMEWSEASDGACIFWLNGMAGTGKSTIARTVAGKWASERRLGASFFFSRGEGYLARASRFFTTIAYQLARSGLAPAVREAICAYPDIPRKNMSEQWKHLILEPLSQPSQMQSLILVIDALDECDDEADVEQILGLLSQAKSLTPVRLRIFVTSRPETPVRYGFQDIQEATRQEFVLHNVANAIIDQDIYVFLLHELSRIQKRRRLSNEWPDREKLHRLVQKADGLFIYATTVCRFIGCKDNVPQDRLASVLEESVEDGSSTKQLDLIYTTVLDHAVIKGREPQTQQILLQRFRRIVGSIVILSDSLTARALAQLLGTQLTEVEQTLDSLSSVLTFSVSGSQESPIRLLHLSFRDFLLDDQRCQDPHFSIVGNDAHKDLALSCLTLMSRSLKEDVCSLRHPGSLTSEVDPSTIRRCLPQEVQYACRYWVDHIRHSNVTLCDGGTLHDLVHAFLKQHLLHLFEVWSLMGIMHDAVLMVKLLDSMLTPKANHSLRAMSRDAVRFILNTRAIIEIAPLQLYCAALPFSPSGAILRNHFADSVPSWIIDLTGVPEDWDSLMQVLEGHSGGVSAVAFSHDGKLLASASADKTVRLWDPTTGTCRATLEGHWDRVGAVAFSPDGKLLASASADTTVRLWDPATGTCRATLEGHSKWVSAVAFSHDGKLLASASADTTVRLWDPATGTCRATLEGHSQWVSAVAFSHDGKLLASASNDRTVRLWDPATGTCRATLEGHSDCVNAVAFSHDGKLLASASDDRTVRLWDPATGTCRATLEGHSDCVNAVAFSHDGKLLASASDDRTVRLWDPATGTCRATLEGHSQWVSAVAFSHDGKLLASASADTTVRLWDPATGTCRATLEGHSQCVSAVAFSHDGKLLASASYDKTVRLWDPATGTCRATLEGHSDLVWAVAFSHDGKLLASASYDETVRLWDPATGTCRATLEGHSRFVNAVAFSPDGKLLASASYDKTVRLWDPATGTCRATLEGHSDCVNAVAFSFDGKLLASASYDKTVRLWDPATGTCRATLEGHSDWVRAVAFSPDGKLLASASDDTTVRLWDPATGTCRATLEGHSKGVRAVAFSPDGKLLLVTSWDNTVHCFDVEEILSTVNTVAVSNPFIPIVLHFNRCEALMEVAPGTDIGFNLGTSSQSILSLSGGWVTLGKQKLLLPPSDLRPHVFAVYNNVVALGCQSGRVWFVKLDLDGIA